MRCNSLHERHDRSDERIVTDTQVGRVHRNGGFDIPEPEIDVDLNLSLSKLDVISFQL